MIKSAIVLFIIISLIFYLLLLGELLDEREGLLWVDEPDDLLLEEELFLLLEGALYDERLELDEFFDEVELLLYDDCLRGCVLLDDEVVRVDRLVEFLE